MPKLSKFQTSPEKSRDGVWVHYAENFWVRVARAGNPKYEARLMRLLKPHRRRISMAENRAAAEKPFVIEAASHDIVTGWGSMANGQIGVDGEVIEGAEDLLDDDGQPIPPEPAKIEAVLKQEGSDPLWRFIDAIASTEALFRQEDVEDAAGN